ncbi:hypothetical protein EDD21DRAFT_166904 [Dissophora ornata]|nr:hypothetical protein EDD21DRAFT_166904 [Dissophora ornata]
MEHINKVCEQEGYPIVVENSPTLGNHAKAARDIPQGEGLLRAVPYAAEVLDSYKKRMCHVCLLYHGRGSFSHRCQDCDQVYYCSLACKTVAMDPLAGAHGKICKTLRKLATWDSNRHTKSIIKLLLQVLMGHWRERQGIPSAYKSRRLFQEILEKRKASDESAQVSDSESLRLALDLESKLDIINQNKDAALATRELYDETVSVTGEKKRNDVETKQDDETLRVQEPVENDFYDFLRLQSHFEDWDEDDTKDWDRQSQIVLSFLEIAGLTEIAAERDGPLKKLTSLDVKRLISVLESNAFGMFDCSKKKEVCFGRGNGRRMQHLPDTLLPAKIVFCALQMITSSTGFCTSITTFLNSNLPSCLVFQPLLRMQRHSRAGRWNNGGSYRGGCLGIYKCRGDVKPVSNSINTRNFWATARTAPYIDSSLWTRVVSECRGE